jgi:pyruvate dehydrogenase E2 component (dihydrolipoamide acetyltransferase)
MMQEFKLPDLGEGVHEGEIVDVLVSVGDSVEEGQPILTVETDKATVEIPSPYTGAVKEIKVKPGEMVRVGTVLMVFETGKPEEEAPTPRAEKAEVLEEAEAGREEPKAEETKVEPERRKPPEPQRPSEPQRVPEPERPTAPERSEGPVPASPATRHLARELGVDLRRVTPSGPAGLVTADDVRRFAEGAKAAPEAPAPQPEPAPESAPVERPSAEAPPLPDFDRWGQVQREPLRSIRRATARQMALAWSQIPHVSHRDEADITELELFRKKLAPDVEAQGGKLTITIFAMKAAVAALKKHPGFNSSIDMKSEEIIMKQYYNIGVAVDSGRGLIVPVIRDVDRKNITELAIELTEIVQRVRDGKATVEDMHGGTFTITNIGAIGGTGFSPIINYPEAAIMGMAKARLQPVVKGDAEAYEITPRLIMPMIVAFDHRVVDGADAARFLRMIVDILENPEKMVLAI